MRHQVCGSLMVVFVALIAAGAWAGIVTVDTSGGSPEGIYVWTVNYPEFGDYTVTVSGVERRGPYDSRYWYRNGSEYGEEDATITWAASGLPSSVAVTSFSLSDTRVTSSVGTMQRHESYDLLFSGPDCVSDSRSSTDILADFDSVDPGLSVRGNFLTPGPICNR